MVLKRFSFSYHLLIFVLPHRLYTDGVENVTSHAGIGYGCTCGTSSKHLSNNEKAAPAIRFPLRRRVVGAAADVPLLGKMEEKDPTTYI